MKNIYIACLTYVRNFDYNLTRVVLVEMIISLAFTYSHLYDSSVTLDVYKGGHSFGSRSEKTLKIIFEYTQKNRGNDRQNMLTLSFIVWNTKFIT